MRCVDMPTHTHTHANQDRLLEVVYLKACLCKCVCVCVRETPSFISVRTSGSCRVGSQGPGRGASRRRVLLWAPLKVGIRQRKSVNVCKHLFLMFLMLYKNVTGTNPLAFVASSFHPVTRSDPTEARARKQDGTECRYLWNTLKMSTISYN